MKNEPGDGLHKLCEQMMFLASQAQEACDLAERGDYDAADGALDWIDTEKLADMLSHAYADLYAMKKGATR